MYLWCSFRRGYVSGLLFGRTEAKGEQVNKTMALANELHQSFRQKHRVVCCSILTSKMTMGSPEHMEQCIGFTGEIAETTAKIIARELAYELSSRESNQIHSPESGCSLI